MLGHVAENIIQVSQWSLGMLQRDISPVSSFQHTNAILDDPTLQPDHIKETLGGGDEQ